MSNKLLLILIPLLAFCEGFKKEEFLEKYCKIDYYSASFRFDFEKVLLCKDVNLSESDAESFKKQVFDISDEEVVVFDGGDVGVVNSDFFKQFPRTKQIIFSNLTANLKPSENLEENHSIETVAFIKCTLSRNQKTNALHSLPDLKIFVITGCYLEHTSIDGELLKMNKNLVDVTVSDSGIHPPQEHVSLLKHIDDDAFDNLDKVEILYLSVHAMSKASSQWYQNKQLKEALILGEFVEFPENIPVSIEDLDVSFMHLKHIRRDHVKYLKNLKRLSMCHGQIEKIDEDAFDDLENLEQLYVNTNSITHFPISHLKELKKLRLFGIGNNPIDDYLRVEKELTEMGFEKTDLFDKRSGYFARKVKSN